MYINKSDALLRAKERAANAGIEADAFLGELLDLSAGTAGNTVHYRPFFAAATWLAQSPQFQQLSEADGVVFTKMKDAIADLRSLQYAYDARYHLVVPEGFEIAVEASATVVQSPAPMPSVGVVSRVLW